MAESRDIFAGDDPIAIARRWLEEADALAGKGQFEEAVHLLLYRSIEDIEKQRPDLLR